MARQKRSKHKANATAANVGYEAELWQMADALRGSMDAAEYKHVVLGLIFLKYISDAFEEKHAQLVSEKAQGADPEDPDEYRAQSIFWVPPEARWSHLKAQARQPTVGQIVDDAMAGIERDNPALKDVLPKEYARPALDKQRLGQLIDMISNLDFRSDQPSPGASRRPLPEGEGKNAQVPPSPHGRGAGGEGRHADDLTERVFRGEDRHAADLLGRVYEYFLSQFASAEGKKGGEFYTPRCVVKLLVEMLEPFRGRVYDPCCGSSGMFVQSVEFIRAHATGNGNGGKAKGDISIYGQESNYTTWRLAKMNLAIRGIDGQIAHGDTFHNDRHPDLRADYILANPPFNVSDWRGELLREDRRWEHGVPPVGNANFAWVQHIVYHLAPAGVAGFVLANGSMSSNQSGEGEIRKNLVEADLVDCMVALPGQLFYSTQIPACLWFIARDRRGQPSPGASRHPLPKGEGHYRGGYDFAGQVECARKLREKATPAEQVFWEFVRDRRFMGLKFRRQHQIGDYVADFYCDEQKLVIELDGPVHDTPVRQPVDKKRDTYLGSLGLRIIRIRNDEVLESPENVLATIAKNVTPLPLGEGKGVRGTGFRDRRGEILFIDARKMGRMVDRTHRELTSEDIAKIANTYHAWRTERHPSPFERGDGGEGVAGYVDVPGFCKSATLEEIRRHGHVLTPGRYVGAEAQEDDGEPFEDKMKRLTKTLREQQAEAAKLDDAITANLKHLGFWE